MVPQAGAEVAREVLLEAEMAPHGASRQASGRQVVRAAARRVVFGGGALAALVTGA